MYTKKEIKLLTISILLIAFAFAFDDKQPTLILSYWILNFIKTILIVAVSFLIIQTTQKLIARRYNADIEYSFWRIRQWGFQPHKRFPYKFGFLGKTILKIPQLPIGIILLLITSFFSLGKFFFIAINSYELKETKRKRAHRTFMHLTEFENAKIALAFPLTALFLALVIKAIAPNLTNFIFINQMLALFNMIPLSTLNGNKIFMNSKPLYLFSLALIVLTIAFMSTITSLLSLTLSFIMALLILLLYFIKTTD